MNFLIKGISVKLFSICGSAICAILRSPFEKQVVKCRPEGWYGMVVWVFRGTRKSILISAAGLFIFFQVSAQHPSSTIEWYKSYLSTKGIQPVEKLLGEKADQLLAAVEIQDDSAQTFLLLETGLVYLTRKYDYDSAMVYFLKGLEVADAGSYPTGKLFSYLAIAHVFQEVGNNEKCLQFLERAVAIARTLNQPVILVFVLNELGKVNVSMDKIEEAFENYEHVLRYKDQVRQPAIEADALFNLGNLYKLKREYAKSLSHHKQALILRRASRDKMQEGLLLNEIGDVYYLMKNHERALANYRAALEVYQAIDFKKGIAEAYNNIGALYYHQNNFKQAAANLELALSAGRSSQTKDPVRKSYDYLSLTLKELGEYKRALEYKELFVNMNDFILKEENDQKLLEVQNRHAMEQKELQIEKLEFVRTQREREIAEQKRLQRFLYALIGLGVLVVALMLYLYLLKRRSNRQLKTINAKVEAQNIELQNLNATKDKFFSIIGHDLKGPLNSLTSFSNLLINYFDSLSKEEIQTLARDLDKSLKNLFSLLNNLLEWARSQTGNIDFTSEQFDITQVLEQNKELLSTQAATKEITIMQESAGSLLVAAHKQSLTTVVRNLISNAIKFTPQGGLIKLGAELRNGEMVVSIADTGVGMSQAVVDKLFRIDAKHSTLGTANEKGTGLGLILCKDFIEKNGGRLWVESEEGKGSVFYFTVPAGAG
jgi:signal transduction histidine kinase